MNTKFTSLINISFLVVLAMFVSMILAGIVGAITGVVWVQTTAVALGGLIGLTLILMMVAMTIQSIREDRAHARWRKGL